MTEADLLRVYKKEVEKTGRTASCLSLTRQVKSDLSQLLSFCDKHNLDPERWIRAKFDAVDHAFQIPIPALTGSTPEFLEKFRDWLEDKQAADMGTDRLNASVVEDTPRDGVELIMHAEIAKLAYVLSGEQEICLLLSLDMTLGWNPASEHCRVCRLAEECREALPESIRRRRDAWGG